MSLLLLVSFYEFRQFLQIVLWIAVPATLIAIGLTIFFHYRRKKKQEELGLAFNDNNSWAENLSGTPASATIVKTATSETPEGMPDWLASANPDNTSLLKKYEHEVRRYRENYAILEQEFRELEGKYTDLRNKAYNGDKDTDTKLVAELQQAEQHLQQVQEENNRLQQLVALRSSSTNGDQQDAMRALQENLATEQQKTAALETKLEQSSRLLVKIYGELAKSINHNELMVS